MATIFELVTANDIVAYWDGGEQNRAPYLGEELFPSDQKLGLKLDWIKGAKGLPVVLAPSAFDVEAKKRDRIGIDKLTAEMPFFKESTMVDEETRQQLNMVLETNNQAYIDAVINRIFDDETSLLEGAAAQRERMRMMALTTGAISIVANGQAYNYDYQVPANHKVTAAVSWSNPDADIIEEVRTWLDTVEDDTGSRPTRAVVSRKTWGYLRKNNVIKKTLFVLSNGQATVSDNKLREYLIDELGLTVVVYNKKCKDEAGNTVSYIPDDTFVAFPDGALGKGWFGTTPEQSDLMSNAAANVALTDTGVAVTTTKKTDPVNVDTKVTMIYMPSFEQADKIIIADVIAE